VEASSTDLGTGGRGRGVSEKLQHPSSKFQAPEKLQTSRLWVDASR